MDIITASSYAGALMVLGGFALALHRKAIKPTVAGVKRILSVMAMMEAEFKPNGGSTLRDAVNRIENSLALQDATQMAMLRYDDRGIFHTDAGGNQTLANVSYYHILGRSPEEVQGTGWISYVHPQDRAKVQKEWDSAFREAREFKFRYRFLTPAGVPFWVQVEASVLKDARTGKTIGAIGFLTRAVA